MSKLSQGARRVALFVEGDTERGEARRRTLSAFFHRWLDPQLPPASKVGITPVKFQGVSNYLDDLPQKVALYLDDGRANFVFGLIDLYGIPVITLAPKKLIRTRRASEGSASEPSLARRVSMCKDAKLSCRGNSRIDLSKYSTIQEKVKAGRAYIPALVPQEYRERFRQHFAVHEIEAWLLAYPEQWPAEVRSQITKRPPEQVDFNEPPAKFLKRILGGRYKKTTTAMNVFPRVDPQGAINQCPHLKHLVEDMLAVARLLQ